MRTAGQQHCTMPQQPDEIRKLGRGMADQLHVVWGLTGTSSYTTKPAAMITTKGLELLQLQISTDNQHDGVYAKLADRCYLTSSIKNNSYNRGVKCVNYKLLMVQTRLYCSANSSTGLGVRDGRGTAFMFHNALSTPCGNTILLAYTLCGELLGFQKTVSIAPSHFQ